MKPQIAGAKLKGVAAATLFNYLIAAAVLTSSA
jgi:hypothetical protein